MRWRSSRLRRPAAVLTLVMMVIGLDGCEAKSYGSPGSRSEAPHLTMVAPRTPPFEDVPGAPLSQRAVFDGLQSRAQQASADATDAGASVIAVVLDRDTGQSISNGNNSPMPIASVAKLFIADDLLLQAAKGQTDLTPNDRKQLDIMLRASDDDAANDFWDRGGGSAIIDRVSARYGLSTTTKPYDGKWWNTMSTAADLTHYYDLLLSGGGGLPADKANVILSDLAQSAPSGIDGYPQRFGIPDGLPADPVAVKQGWMCCWNGGDWMHMSTGVVGADRRFVMVVGTMQPADDAIARQTITQVVKTMFPTGRI
jgi:hypothetical protein